MPLPREQSTTPPPVPECVVRPVRVLIWACLKGWIRIRYRNVARLDAVALQALLDTPSSTGWLILDARTHDEYAVSHLPGAVPLDTGTTKTDEEIEVIADSKTHPVLLVCSVGLRSAMQALKLKRSGFKRVAHLDGGLFEWVNRGHTLVSQGKCVHKVHPYNLLWGLLLRPPHG